MGMCVGFGLGVVAGEGDGRDGVWFCVFDFAGFAVLSKAYG